MSASDQLSMFEPEGAELARLADRHARMAESLRRNAAANAARGFEAVARTVEGLARESDELAAVCAMALQFEREAGL